MYDGSMIRAFDGMRSFEEKLEKAEGYSPRKSLIFYGIPEVRDGDPRKYTSVKLLNDYVPNHKWCDRDRVMGPSIWRETRCNQQAPLGYEVPLHSPIKRSKVIREDESIEKLAPDLKEVYIRHWSNVRKKGKVVTTVTVFWDPSKPIPKGDETLLKEFPTIE
ncbi:hypothetical protein ElyMa_001380900 [Elysia marginata]|uniref:Uncharacterized protein n=1 Tax=Elysia marginata TaxID=1093978 RepID=A0AAV4IRQ9_9GAST|nr:hypothetical protein ElyMa_001380900 [Elysia marginata]